MELSLKKNLMKEQLILERVILLRLLVNLKELRVYNKHFAMEKKFLEPIISCNFLLTVDAFYMELYIINAPVMYTDSTGQSFILLALLLTAVTAGAIAGGIDAYNKGGTVLDIVQGVVFGIGIGIAVFRFVTVLTTVLVPSFTAMCGFTGFGLFNFGMFAMGGGAFTAALSKGFWLDINIESNKLKNIEEPRFTQNPNAKTTNFYIV